jgi:hypothetical protein
MANHPRKHHYIPSFYLAGFTMSGSDQDRLNVFDQGKIKTWPSSPKNAGHSRDFYAIELGPDVDPACFESEVLARVEGEAGRVVQTAVKTERLPQGRDFDVLLNFVAVMAARTPRIRRLVGQVTNLVVKASVQSLVATDEGWQQFRNYCQDAGIEQSEGESEQMRQFILGGEYEVDLDQTSHVQEIVELVNAMLPLLAQRHWLLGIAAPGMPDFVCSDAPVSAAPTNLFGPADEMHLANHHTRLSMPLTRRTVLLGYYEERPSMFYVNEFGVLSMNAMTITEARYIFFGEDDFAYLGGDKKLKRKGDLEESLHIRKGKYSHLDEAVAHWFQTRTAFGSGAGGNTEATPDDGGEPS